MKRYYITDRHAAGGFHALLEIIRDQIHMGVDYIQIREKDLSARQLFEFSLAVLEVRQNGMRQNEVRENHPTKILLNSRADVAAAIGADGVHLTADAPEETLPGLLVARSCHTLGQIKLTKADFVVFSPVFQGHNHSPRRRLRSIAFSLSAGQTGLCSRRSQLGQRRTMHGSRCARHRRHSSLPGPYSLNCISTLLPPLAHAVPAGSIHEWGRAAAKQSPQLPPAHRSSSLCKAYDTSPRCDG